MLEEALAHEAFGGVGDVVAGDSHAFAHLQTGVAEHDFSVVVAVAFHGDVGDFIDFGHGGVNHRRIEDSVGNSLSEGGGGHRQAENRHQQFEQFIMHSDGDHWQVETCSPVRPNRR